MSSFVNNLWKIISTFLAVFSILASMFGSVTAPTASFKVNAGELGAPIGNKVSNINFWANSGVSSGANHSSDYFRENFRFVEYMQLMQATGGSAERDLFLNPFDTSVMEDYDFSSIINACRVIVNQGALPHIKTGNVPMKFTSGATAGFFGVNLYPPDDYNRYYTYICDIASALLDEFGLAEVSKWRWGVLTEYENKDWFMAKSGNPEDSLIAYCKLYDYTVAALQDTIGKEVNVGAHSMTVTEGLWDERGFIEHCAKGTNYKTGKIGTKIDFLAVSFYDNDPNKTTKLTLPETIDILRRKAQSVGLNNLIYGVDEGRLLRGTDRRELLVRSVGYTYQAGYDARLLKQMVDYDIDYFSNWGYTTSGIWDNGIPAVSHHVANRFYEMVGSKEIDTKKSKSSLSKVEIDALAGYNESTKTLHIMGYNFKHELENKQKASLKFDINVPQFKGKTVTITQYMINDDANFFDEWVRDREIYGITQDDFAWSSDDATLESTNTLKSQWARELYFSTLRSKYVECAKLIPTSKDVVIEDGKLILDITLDANAVVFYEISMKD